MTMLFKNHAIKGGGEGVTPKANFLSRWGREMVRRGAKYVHVILGQPLKIAYKI